MKKLLFAALLAIVASPATAQIIPSGAQPIQGTELPNRGYPVNIVQTDGVGNVVAPPSATGQASTNTKLDTIHADLIAPLPAAVTTAAPSYTNLTTNSLSLTLNGDLRTQAEGAAANNAAPVGNPIQNGCAASTATPTAVTTANMARQWCGLHGELVVTPTDQTGTAITNNTTADANAATIGMVGGRNYNLYFNGITWDRVRGDVNGAVNQPFAMPPARWAYAAAAGGITNTTTAVTVAAAAGASVRNYVASMQCVTTGVMGAASEIALRDGAAGTVLWRGFVDTSGLTRGGINYEFATPLKGTANTLVELVSLTASVTGALYCDVQGFTGS